MKYDIIGEAHVGVAEVSEEVFDTVEADSEEEAMKKYALMNPRQVCWSESWNVWLWNARHIWATPHPWNKE